MPTGSDGVLRLPLLPAQADFVGSEAKFPAMVGGWGSGKTHAGAWRLVLKMANDPGITTGYYGSDFTMLEDRPKTAIEDALDEVGVRYNYQASRYLFDCGKFGTIKLKSFTDKSRIRSGELAHVVIDEIEQLNQIRARQRFEQIVGRMRGTAGATIGVMTTPDNGTSGFVYSRWGQPKGEFETIFASTLDNYHIPDLAGYVRSIEEVLEPRLVPLYLHGQFVALGEGMCYYTYIEGEQAMHRPVPPPPLPHALYVGLDFNIEACFAAVGIYDGQSLHIVDEFVSRNTLDFCEKVKSRYPEQSVTVCADATGGSRSTNATKSDIDLIRAADIATSTPKGNPRVMDRVMSVNAAFSSGRLHVDPVKCPLLHRGLMDHAFKDGAPEKSDEHPRNAGSLDDRTDALGYLVHRLIPVVKPSFDSGIRMAG